jgi:hypothetical protein
MNNRLRLVNKLLKQRQHYFAYRFANNSETKNYTNWLRSCLLSIRCPIINRKSYFKSKKKRRKVKVRVQITEPNGSIIKEVECLWLKGVEASYEYEGKNEKES